MGAVLEMKMRAFALMSLLSLLGACGNDTAGQDTIAPAKVLLAAIKNGAARQVAPVGDPNDPAIRASMLSVRAQLAKAGQPILLVSNSSLKYAALHVPFGQNGDVQTWASVTYQEISLRNGVLTATRGFGPDLMSSQVPSLATIASGQGNTKRRHYYLDGADQRQVFDYTCNLTVPGREQIDVLGMVYMTRRVEERCVGSQGTFTNVYWFDGSQHLRQSSQHLAPGIADMFIQRAVD